MSQPLYLAAVKPKMPDGQNNTQRKADTQKHTSTYRHALTMGVCVQALKGHKQRLTCNHSQKHRHSARMFLIDGSNYSGVMPLTFVPDTPSDHL